MSQVTKLKSVSLLTLIVALALPLAAQEDPCFKECHDEAMEREDEGMDWEENNETFLECNDEC